MFTEEEAKVYDRQIRLWGIKAQQQIRSADVLVVGLAGLASEVVKNLVLAGINSITLVDDQIVTDFDMLSNLFTRHQIGKNRAEAVEKAVHELNPMVNVKVLNKSLSALITDHESSKAFLKAFHVVVLINHDINSTIKLNKLCNECQLPFFSACAWGYYSMMFCDLGSNVNNMKFVPFEQALKNKSIRLKNNRKLSKRDMIKISKLQSIFVAMLTLYKYHDSKGNFPELLDENDQLSLVESLKTLEKDVLAELNSEENNETPKWTSIEGWHSKVCGQFTFVSSIVGGLLAQEVIRSVTNDIIDYNLFIFDGLEGFNLHFGM